MLGSRVVLIGSAEQFYFEIALTIRLLRTHGPSVIFWMKYCWASTGFLNESDQYWQYYVPLKRQANYLLKCHVSSFLPISNLFFSSVIWEFFFFFALCLPNKRVMDKTSIKQILKDWRAVVVKLEFMYQIGWRVKAGNQKEGKIEFHICSAVCRVHKLFFFYTVLLSSLKIH